MFGSLFKVAGLKTSNFIKERPKHRFFCVNIAKFLRTPILQSIWKRSVNILASLMLTWNNVSILF